MILVFDLDDTLYSEITYVKSGLAAVAEHLTTRFHLSRDDVYAELLGILQSQGRGHVFNTFLESRKLNSSRNVLRCLSIYRTHTPDIKLFDETLPTLNSLGEYPQYLVTDGNKVVQHNKVRALDLYARFKKVYITHRYGVRHAKPSTYCFRKVLQLEDANWSDLVYIGDNPAKDFVNLNKVGATTVRVRTGPYGEIVAKAEYDAQHSIDHIKQLPSLLCSHQSSW